MSEITKKVILFVDGDPSIQTVFRLLFQEKYELLFADSGEEALHVFNQCKALDLIILDYRLPGMDGIALFKKIRREDRVTPILFTSGHASKELLVQMIDVRPHGFVEKPWNNEQLQQKIDRLVGGNPFQLVHETLNIPIHSLSIKIFRALQYIDRHHGSPSLSLEGVGQAVSLHPKYLSASFKEECKVGFHDYLIEIRIFRARQLLNDPHRIIKQVSTEVGFSDQGYFCKVFQNKIGLSPSIYRKEFLAKKR